MPCESLSFVFRVAGELCLRTNNSWSYQRGSDASNKLSIVPPIEFDTLASENACGALNNSQAREIFPFFLYQGQRAVHRMRHSALVISLRLVFVIAPSLQLPIAFEILCNWGQSEQWFTTSNDWQPRSALCCGNFSLFVSFMALLGVRLSLEVVASLKAHVPLAESPEYLQNKADDTTRTTWHAHSRSFRLSA